MPPAIRALDCLPGSETFVAGSSRCEVWEVDKDPEPLIVGHEGTVYALAMHPKVRGTAGSCAPPASPTCKIHLPCPPATRTCNPTCHPHHPWSNRDS